MEKEKKINIDEKLIEFVWFSKLFLPRDYKIKSTEGKEIKIINIGQKNHYSGPDIENVRVLVNGILFVGLAEIHVKTSDWKAHKHNDNKEFDKTILHIVYSEDKKIKSSSFFTIELKKHIPINLIERYNRLKENYDEIKCKSSYPKISDYTKVMFFEKEYISRVNLKSEEILKELKITNNDWEATSYITLTKYFGTNINSTAFYFLSKSLPKKVLDKCSNDGLKIQALIFGVSGFLTNIKSSYEYFNILKTEYLYLKKAYNLKEIDFSIWKKGKMRPQNSPSIRMAFLCEFIAKNKNLFSLIKSINNLKDLTKCFDFEINNFWKTHYNFTSKESKKTNKKPGKLFLINILLNVIIPLKYSYYSYSAEENKKEEIIDLANSLPAEKNHIINKFANISLKPKNALDSQAMIHIYKNYCQKSRCIECRIGQNILLNDFC